MRSSNLEKRIMLRKIIMYSRTAIEKLDDVTYYENILINGRDVNEEYFEEMLEHAKQEYEEVIKNMLDVIYPIVI